MNSTGKWSFWVVFIVFSLLILLFLTVPVVKVVSFLPSSGLFSAGLTGRLFRSIFLTFYCGAVSTLLGMIFGVPFGYILARVEFKGKKMIEAIVDLPVVIPHSAAGIALLFVFGKRYLVGRFFHLLGIEFVGEVSGIILAMSFVSVPFLINAVKEGFKKVDVRVEDAARVLGAGPWDCFFSVSIPLVRGSIIAGGLMMWSRGISEFGAVLVITYHPMIAPVIVYDYFENYGFEIATGAVGILVLLSLTLFGILRYLAWRFERGR